MNERIQQLADESAKYSAIMALPTGQSGNELFVEKFAELIVRECAWVAKTLPHTPERHWVQDSVTYIPVHCEQNILKHFGVEE
jgi:hypothetical protein